MSDESFNPEDFFNLDADLNKNQEKLKKGDKLNLPKGTTQVIKHIDGKSTYTLSKDMVVVITHLDYGDYAVKPVVYADYKELYDSGFNWLYGKYHYDVVINDDESIQWSDFKINNTQ